MSAKKIGRPPAKWVYKLAELEMKDDDFLDYHDLSQMFGLTLRSVHGFCTKNRVEGEYYRHPNKVVRKRFRVDELKKAAHKYLRVS
jgi:hypothetical protein